MVEHPCVACGGRCCTHMRFEVFWPHLSSATFNDHSDWLVSHNSPAFSVDLVNQRKHMFIISVVNPCSYHVNGRCDRYESRPRLCKAYRCKALKDYDETGEYNPSDFEAN